MPFYPRWKSVMLYLSYSLPVCLFYSSLCLAQSNTSTPSVLHQATTIADKSLREVQSDIIDRRQISHEINNWLGVHRIVVSYDRDMLTYWGYVEAHHHHISAYELSDYAVHFAHTCGHSNTRNWVVAAAQKQGTHYVYFGSIPRGASRHSINARLHRISPLWRLLASTNPVDHPFEPGFRIFNGATGEYEVAPHAEQHALLNAMEAHGDTGDFASAHGYSVGVAGTYSDGIAVYQPCRKCMRVLDGVGCDYPYFMR
ncbi:hypothetical protein CVT24_005221 [Panaeolus cyanescens]|uniref:CMP/dCMP-type deaminase domain-containing protein n=1 Tax=Panaeolus cyanescens TaxID=181874 RepID=A0A409Y951_9AGAR|nr:hypothetical protein CVT24_005221 [Panaeolus cyanescens]